MAIRPGKNARLKLGTNTIARINSVTLTKNGTTVDTTSFGDDWTKMTLIMNGATLTCDGWWDTSDTYQNTLQSVALSGGSRSNLRYYVDATNYYVPDTVTDSEATAIFKDISVSADKSGVVNFSVSIEFSGPVLLTS